MEIPRKIYDELYRHIERGDIQQLTYLINSYFKDKNNNFLNRRSMWLAIDESRYNNYNQRKDKYDIIKYFLELKKQNIKINKIDDYFDKIARYLPLEIFKLFLEYDNINEDTKKKLGSDILYVAVFGKYPENALYLLKNENIEKDLNVLYKILYRLSIDNNIYDYNFDEKIDRILEIILENEKINVNIIFSDDGLYTPLINSLMYGKFKMAKLLLKRKDIDINMSNKNGQNALNLSINQLLKINENNNRAYYDEIMEIVKTILNNPNIKINLEGETNKIYFRTEKIAFMILENENTIFNYEGVINALETSIEYNIWNSVLWILKYFYFDIKSLNINNKTLFMSILEKSDKKGKIDEIIECLKVILEKYDIDINLKDDDGINPFIFSIKNSINLKLITFLVKLPNINVNIKYKGSTMLIYLCKNAVIIENRRVINLLLQHPDIDIEILDDEGKNASYYYDLSMRQKQNYKEQNYIEEYAYLTKEINYYLLKFNKEKYLYKKFIDILKNIVNLNPRFKNQLTILIVMTEKYLNKGEEENILKFNGRYDEFLESMNIILNNDNVNFLKFSELKDFFEMFKEIYESLETYNVLNSDEFKNEINLILKNDLKVNEYCENNVNLNKNFQDELENFVNTNKFFKNFGIYKKFKLINEFHHYLIDKICKLLH